MLIRKTDLKSKTLFRSYGVERRDIDQDARTVRLSFSSTAPYLRWFGYEILDHKKAAMKLDYLKGGANLLINHDTNDVVGVVEAVEISSDAEKAYATVRFGKSARAEEIFQDVVDGIRKNVSVGYEVIEMKELPQKDWIDGTATYRVTKWQPLEISLVSVPADITVGVGKAHEGAEHTITVIHEQEEKHMHKCKKCGGDFAVLTKAGYCPDCEVDVRQAELEAKRQAEVAVEKKVRQKLEAAQKREADIKIMAEQYKVPENEVREYLRGEGSVEGFAGVCLKHIGKPGLVTTQSLGMQAKDIQRYSVLRAIRMLSEKRSLDGFEREISDQIAKDTGRSAQGFFLPIDLLVRDMGLQKRDLSTSVDAQGGYLVGTTHMSSEFIQMLRNRTMLGRLGVRSMMGLVGNVDIPGQSGGMTFYAITEGGTTTESNLTFTNVSLSPKTTSGRVDVTRRLMLQSDPSVEALVRDDIINGVMVELDRIGINGRAASNEANGILNASGVGAVTIGADGGPITWAKVVELETNVANSNGDSGALAYLTNSRVRGSLKTTEKSNGSGLFLMPEGRDADGLNELNGYACGVSNNVPSNLEKGNSGAVCSALIFGDFNTAVYGFWGALDIKVDETTLGDSGGTVLRAFQDYDFVLRQAAKFATCEEITTS